MTVDPARTSDLNGLKLWAVEHQTEVSMLWTEQLVINKELNGRMKTLERKVLWAAGFAAGLGAMVPWVLAELLGLGT